MSLRTQLVGGTTMNAAAWETARYGNDVPVFRVWHDEFNQHVFDLDNLVLACQDVRETLANREWDLKMEEVELQQQVTGSNEQARKALLIALMNESESYQQALQAIVDAKRELALADLAREKCEHRMRACRLAMEFATAMAVRP